MYFVELSVRETSWYKIDNLTKKQTGCRNPFIEIQVELRQKIKQWSLESNNVFNDEKVLISFELISPQHLDISICCSSSSSCPNWPLSLNPSPLWLLLAGRSRRANLLVIWLGMPWRLGGGGGPDTAEDGGGWCGRGQNWGKSGGDWRLWAWLCAASEHWQYSEFLPQEPGTSSPRPSSAPPCLS